MIVHFCCLLIFLRSPGFFCPPGFRRICKAPAILANIRSA
ncbi:hypothetical protein HMPREF1548_05194 [Clostridium sp. KLE 1755]|nr:hypothetical protein HMPREF1548_05194 [Clostridium sp. KLE 1755]